MQALFSPLRVQVWEIALFHPGGPYPFPLGGGRSTPGARTLATATQSLRCSTALNVAIELFAIICHREAHLRARDCAVVCVERRLFAICFEPRACLSGGAICILERRRRQGGSVQAIASRVWVAKDCYLPCEAESHVPAESLTLLFQIFNDPRFARLGRHGAGGKGEYFLEYLKGDEQGAAALILMHEVLPSSFRRIAFRTLGRHGAGRPSGPGGTC